MEQEIVRENVTKMMYRRGYPIKKYEENYTLYSTSDKSHLIAVYFIDKSKVTINSITAIFATCLVKHVIIIYSKSLTTDAEHSIKVNNVFKFETFSFAEMSFDLLDIITPHTLLLPTERIGTEEFWKFPKILATDIVARYYNFKSGSIIKIEETPGKITLRTCV